MEQTFGDRVRILRKRRGMTQADLASALGVTVQTIVRYEGLKKAEELRPGRVEQIAQALGTEPPDLIGSWEDGEEEIRVLTRGLRNMDPAQREKLIGMMMPLIREYQLREEGAHGGL